MVQEIKVGGESYTSIFDYRTYNKDDIIPTTEIITTTVLQETLILIVGIKLLTAQRRFQEGTYYNNTTFKEIQYGHTTSSANATFDLIRGR